jgi:hypothetical protein
MREQRVVPNSFNVVCDNHTINNLPIGRLKKLVPMLNIKKRQRHKHRWTIKLVLRHNATVLHKSRIKKYERAVIADMSKEIRDVIDAKILSDLIAVASKK